MDEEKKNDVDDRILSELENKAGETLDELVNIRFKIIELKKREHEILTSHFEKQVGDGNTQDFLGEFNKYRKNLLFLRTDLQKLKEKMEEIERRIEERWG